jgi:carboxylesterase type B
MAPWKGVWDASTIAPQCLTFDHRMHPMDDTKIKGHEDCLYLNIYTPTVSKSNVGFSQFKSVFLRAQQITPKDNLCR